MRCTLRVVSVFVALSLVTGCDSGKRTDGESAPGDTATVSAATLTPAVRARVEDSVRAFLRRYDEAVRQRDLEAWMNALPDTGRYVLAGPDGLEIVPPDSMRAMLKRVFAEQRSMSLSTSIKHIDVLAPDAAAVATTFEVRGTDTTGMQWQAHGPWTFVLAQRGGRFVELQGHETWIWDKGGPPRRGANQPK